MAIIVPLKSIFDNTGVRSAEKQFINLGKVVKGALGAVGISVGLQQTIQALNDAAKAAVSDNKSQALLALQLKNTTGATQDQVAAVEKSIQSMELQSAVMDDKIRPAMAALVRATGDVGKATDLTNLALNVSAGTGRDLQSVAIALGKAYQGNTTALQRLGINVKGVKDPMAALVQQFDGAAKAAANTDPYARMQVVFDNLQETIGRAVLPYLEQFSTWLASPDGQANLKLFTDTIASWVTTFGDAALGLVKIGKGFQDLFGIFDGWKPPAWFGNLVNLVPGASNLGTVVGLLGEVGRAGKDTAVQTDETTRLIRRRLESLGAITPVPVVDKIKKQGDAAKAAAKAAADALKAAKDAADAQAKAYLDAADAATKLLDANTELMASFKDVFATKTEMGQFEQSAVDAFTGIFDQIKSAVGDGKILNSAAEALTTYARKEQAALQAIGKQRDILAGKIDVAKTITGGVMGLANLTSFLESTSKTVTETVTSMVNGIQVATTKTFDITQTSGLVDNFQKLVDKTRAFAKNILTLKQLGLNKNLFAQLVNAGADAGGATAQAIVDGGTETISALNGLYSDLAASAGDIASTATDTLYEVGQQIVSNGFIEGLMSQDSALAQAAQTLADSFAATFSGQLASALGLALPDITTNPLAGFTPNPADFTGGAGGMSGGFRAANINVNISAGVVTDPNGLAKTFIDSVKKYERSNGSVWVAA